MENNPQDPFFVSEYTHSLDGKHRVVMPKKWRVAGDEGDFYMALYHNTGGYLMVYPPKQVAKLRNRINSLNEGAQNKHLLEQALFGGAFHLGCDAAGRITLPEKLVTRAGFKKDTQVTFVGQGESFSLWDTERLNDHKNKQPEIDVFATMASLGL